MPPQQAYSTGYRAVRYRFDARLRLKKLKNSGIEKQSHSGDKVRIYGNKLTAICGVFIALAMILSYLESLVPITALTPGIKLGLANLVTIIVLLKIGVREAFFISVGRIILSGILFGNVSVIIYSLVGAFFSIAAMSLLSKIKKLSVTTISIAGGIMHNFGQIIVAVITIENTAIFYYMFVLGIAGAVSGTIVGLLAGAIMNRISIS